MKKECKQARLEGHIGGTMKAKATQFSLNFMVSDKNIPESCQSLLDNRFIHAIVVNIRQSSNSWTPDNQKQVFVVHAAVYRQELTFG